MRLYHTETETTQLEYLIENLYKPKVYENIKQIFCSQPDTKVEYLSNSANILCSVFAQIEISPNAAVVLYCIVLWHPWQKLVGIVSIESEASSAINLDPFANNVWPHVSTNIICGLPRLGLLAFNLLIGFP